MKLKHYLISGLVLLLSTACSNHSAGLNIDGGSQTVLFGDKVLGERLPITNIATVQENGHARGVVEVTSAYSGDQTIEYRFYWYDDNGLEINPRPSAWKQEIIRGGESRTLSEVSVNPRGTQFKIQIINAK